MENHGKIMEFDSQKPLGTLYYDLYFGYAHQHFCVYSEVNSIKIYSFVCPRRSSNTFHIQGTDSLAKDICYALTIFYGQ